MNDCSVIMRWKRPWDSLPDDGRELVTIVRGATHFARWPSLSWEEWPCDARSPRAPWSEPVPPEVAVRRIMILLRSLPPGLPPPLVASVGWVPADVSWDRLVARGEPGGPVRTVVACGGLLRTELDRLSVPSLSPPPWFPRSLLEPMVSVTQVMAS